MLYPKFKIGDTAKVVKDSSYNNLGSIVTITKLENHGYRAVGYIPDEKMELDLFYHTTELGPVYTVEGFEV